MDDVLEAIERWHAIGERVALATVVSTRRSSPRPVGSKLAIAANGELAGSVSGGCVEGDVHVHAQEVLAGEAPRLLTYGIPDEFAFSVGLPCGGEIDVFVERVDPGLQAKLHALVQRDGHGVVFTILEGEKRGSHRLALEGDPAADEALRRGRSHVVEEAGTRVFADVYGPPPRLLVFGAVDTAEELCRAAKRLGWRAIVADPRARFATRERVPSADELLVCWPEEALDRVPPAVDTAVVVLTHEDKFDLPALTGALRSAAFYVGAIGSRRNQARRRELLLEGGLEEGEIDRIFGPSGLDIGAHTPAETALSIMAEILAVRAERAGGSLRAASGRIHAEVG